MIRFTRKGVRLLLWIFNIVLKQIRKNPHNYDMHVILDAVAIHRYILTLHSNALHHGERLILNTSISSVISAHNMNHSRYHTMVYEECFFSFDKSNRNATLLDHHYFQSSQHYRVPIGFHPLFTPPKSVDLSNKKPGSIQFLGNSQREYEKFDSTFWGMPSRITTLKLIQSQYPELGYRTNNREEYREILFETTYFICLPGFCMPLCHNLYESMICGCIPLLHVNYAKWLDSKLQSLLKQVTYNNDLQLLEWIEQIKNNNSPINEKELAQNLITYCKDKLSWQSIKSSIQHSDKSLICAEEVSVKLAMSKRQGKPLF